MISKQASIQTPQIVQHFTAVQWLSYIEALHPKAISMGLERVAEVATRLKLNPTFPIITVAGTNGKGSTCAMLSAIYCKADYQVGCYTSPHLIRYNERIQINQQEISDEALCVAFIAIESARCDAILGEVCLTYFEISTLAAMWHFCQQQLDVVILEVGLGGRLDAVNVFEPTCAIVTTVDLDHMEYLGDTREKIGFEKAGIYRTQKLAICGDDEPPNALINFAEEINANLKLINRDFSVQKINNVWQYLAKNHQLNIPKLALNGDFQRNNAACVITAVIALRHLLLVTDANIVTALASVTLIGRFFSLQTLPTIIVDVAHNPQAALSLAHNLKTTPCTGRTIAVFAMLQDKDIAGVVQVLLPIFDEWFLADIHHPRGAKASALQVIIIKQNPHAIIQNHATVASALQTACKVSAKNDRIIVFGSFYTVTDAILLLRK